VIFLKVPQKKLTLYCHGDVMKRLPSHRSVRIPGAVQIHTVFAVCAFNMFYTFALNPGLILDYFRINVRLLDESQGSFGI
jgi:hypothetical protein